MEDFVLKMAELYRKIKNGSASEEEKFRFEVEVKTSCINEKILMYLIETATKE